MRLITDLAQRQLTRLELALVVIVLGVLALLGYQRLEALGAQAEEVSLNVTINNLRTAVSLEALVAHAKGEAQRIPQLAGSDPMQLMRATPPHPLTGPDEGERSPRRYLGALLDADPATIEPGHWYFDAANNELVYRVRHVQYFRSEQDGPARVRLRVEVDGDAEHRAYLRVIDAYDWRR